MKRTASWLSCPIPREAATVSLVCFPFAGAGIAAFAAWARMLDPRIELHIASLPGRDRRIREPHETRQSVVVGALSEAVSQLADRPLLLMGHSLGALIAFEVARSLRAAGGPQPKHLVISGRRGPRIPDHRPPISNLPDDAFVSAMSSRYGGIPKILLQEPELLARFLPSLKADMTLYEQYQYRPEPPLAVPISAWCGQSDPGVSPEALEAWQQETTADFSMRWFSGEHFYLQPRRAEVLRALADLI